MMRRLREENARLKAENARLQAALNEIFHRMVIAEAALDVTPLQVPRS
jgi:hypothetical protein